jgi:hypothetical protein
MRRVTRRPSTYGAAIVSTDQIVSILVFVQEKYSGNACFLKSRH